MSQQPKRKYLHKLKSKYRLSIYNDQTFQEVWHMRLSRLNVISAVGGLALLLVIGVTLLIALTPIREFIPGYPDGHTRRNIVLNALMVDSLERELRQWELYLGNLHTILRGGRPHDFKSLPDTAIRYTEIQFTRSREDSLLRLQIQEQGRFDLMLLDTQRPSDIFSGLHLFPPVEGIITNPFDVAMGHFGVDIVAPPNEVIVAVADGTVTFAGWTLETGHVIQIQHRDNLLSVYKHNSKLLARLGTFVRAGQAIAIMGNSGELTTGPHLHFELWHEGKPINPEQHIIF